MFDRMRDDIRAVKERDPAATSSFSVALNYPGLHAIWWQRLTHRLQRAGLVFPARVLSQWVRTWTGVEIHPGATIGRGFFIDHGMGVVIGETTVIADNVTLYQNVTLGGTGKETGKRHPTLEDNVVVGVGAVVLGDITIGRASKVGAGAVVINDVPPNCTVVGIPGRVVVREGERIDAIDLHHEDLPDPVIEMFRCLQRRIDRLENRLTRDEGATAEQGPVVGDAPLVAPASADERRPAPVGAPSETGGSGEDDGTGSCLI
jgi:serine O-acetyltransferase